MVGPELRGWQRLSLRWRAGSEGSGCRAAWAVRALGVSRRPDRRTRLQCRAAALLRVNGPVMVRSSRLGSVPSGVTFIRAFAHGALEPCFSAGIGMGRDHKREK